MRYLLAEGRNPGERWPYADTRGDDVPLLAAAVLIVVALVSSSRLVHAAADPVEQLIALLAPLNSLDGQFQQTLTDDKGELLQSSSGVFSLQRPGFFRWQTITPFPQLLVSDRQRIWLYDEDLEQVTIRPYTEALDSTPALLLSDDPRRLSAHYRVARRPQGNDHDTFVLVGKHPRGSFTEIVLSFKNEQLSKMALTDTLGQVSLFVFASLTINPVLAANLFTFEPPAGVDVIIDD